MDVKEIECLSFEDGYTRLEQVIHRLEAGELSLDESIALYEEGVCLARHCGRKLDDAELQVSQYLPCNGAAETQAPIGAPSSQY